MQLPSTTEVIGEDERDSILAAVLFELWRLQLATSRGKYPVLVLSIIPPAYLFVLFIHDQQENMATKAAFITVFLVLFTLFITSFLASQDGRGLKLRDFIASNSPQPEQVGGRFLLTVFLSNRL